MADRELLLGDDIQDESLALVALEKIKENIGVKSISFDESRRVTSYSASSVFFLGWILPFHSVWNWQILLRTLLMCALATLFGHLSCIGPKAVDAQWEFCFPVLSSTDGLVFSSVVSFLLGMFQTLTFNRWWSAREKIGAVIFKSTDFAMQFLSYLKPTPENDHVRVSIVRYLNLAHVLVYKQVNNDHSLGDVIQRKLITPAEAEILSHSPNKPFAVYSWISRIISECITSNPPKIPAAALSVLHGSLSSLVQGTSDLIMFITTQIPYSYVHLLTLITKIHLIFVMFYSAGILQTGINSHSWARIIFAYALIFANQIIYEGLLQIHDVLVNPCGEDIHDFPKRVYQQQVELITQDFLVPSHSVIIDMVFKPDGKKE